MSESEHSSTQWDAVRAGHEPDSANAPVIAGAVFGLAMLAVGALVVVWGLGYLFQSRQPSADTAVTPDTHMQPSVQTPLDANQPATLRDLRSRETRQLQGYGWIDRERDIAAIPIERAKEIVDRQGIPDWAQSSGE